MSHINPGEQPARNVDGDGDLPRIGFLRQDAERFLAVGSTEDTGMPGHVLITSPVFLPSNRWMELLEEAVQNATKHPGAAPIPIHPSPPGSQEPAYQGSTSSRCGAEPSSSQQCPPYHCLFPDSPQPFLPRVDSLLREMPLGNSSSGK